MLCTYFVICILAGVMYWGDAGVMYWGDAGVSVNKIETARIDGTGRETLVWDQTAAVYSAISAILLHDGDIYITDRFSP